MNYDLATMARRQRNIRRASVAIRDIIPPTVLATDLYRAAYLPIVQLWTRAADRIADEYARTLSELTTDAASDLSRILDDADQETMRLVMMLKPALREWVLRLEKWQRDKWVAAVLAAGNVDLSTLLTVGDVAQTLEQVIEWNTALIADVGAQARQRIGNAVFAGLTARSPAREVAKAIREATGMARDRSIRIASDQLSKLSSSLADERQRQAGIEQVEWRSSHKLHPRKHHAARDGKAFYLESREAVDGSETVARGDWVGQPPFCGCRTRAILTFS